MLRFAGYLDRKGFLWAAALRLTLFVASVVGFPFALSMVAIASNCRSVGGACGAVGLVTAVALKPLAFVLLVSSFVGISLRRVRDAGMPAWIGLIIPLLLAADYQFLIFSAAPWSFAFSAGVLMTPVPQFAIFALVCIAVLCIFPSRADSPTSRNPFGPIGLVAFGLALFVAFIAALRILDAVPILGWSTLWTSIPLGRTLWVRYAMTGLAVLFVVMAWRARRDSAVAPIYRISERPPGTAFPIKRLVGLALIPTLVAFAVGVGSQSFSLAISAAVNLVPILLPTFAIYFGIIFALFLVIWRRGPRSIAALMVALLPFAHWGHAQWAAWQEHRQETAEIVAIPTVPAARIPSTLVFESQNWIGRHGVWAVPGIEQVIFKGAYGPALVQFDRPQRGMDTPKQVTVESPPPEYLLLKVARASGFAERNRIYSVDGGPLELRLVGPTRDDLIAVWYRKFNPRPTAIPLLTLSGWYRGSNRALTTETDTAVGRFLAAALAPSRRAGETEMAPNGG
jgi:uncharacterized membrane protein YhaH (DUF805 family)